MAELQERDSVENCIKPLVLNENMELTDLISIIVPVYNAGSFLNNCLDSLVNQTYSNIEILLIDDGSTDECPQIADNYAEHDPRIRVFHKKNGGVSSARNVGLENARGQYIIFVDADDWIRCDTCEMVLKAMLSADANICFYNIVMAPVKGANYIRAAKAPTGVCDKTQMMQEVLRNYYPCVNNKCFRRDVLLDSDLKIIEFDRNTRILEDGLWLMQTSMKWQTGVVLSEGLSFRRLWSGSVMGNKEKELQNRLEFLITFQKLFPIFKTQSEDLYMEAKEYFMTFALASVRKATWKSNRQWLYAYAEEMSKVDPNYALYIYADIYNILSQVKKGSLGPNGGNSRWNGPVCRVIKRLLPVRFKQWLKAVLFK